MENTRIYIPTNVKTEVILFDGFGMGELGKTALFTLVGIAIASITYICKHNLGMLVLIILISAAVGVALTSKDQTNQCVIDYTKNMIRFAKSQKRYLYNNRLEMEVQGYLENESEK